MSLRRTRSIFIETEEGKKVKENKSVKEKNQVSKEQIPLETPSDKEYEELKNFFEKSHFVKRNMKHHNYFKMTRLFECEGYFSFQAKIHADFIWAYFFLEGKDRELPLKRKDISVSKMSVYKMLSSFVFYHLKSNRDSSIKEWNITAKGKEGWVGAVRKEIEKNGVGEMNRWYLSCIIPEKDDNELGFGSVSTLSGGWPFIYIVEYEKIRDEIEKEKLTEEERLFIELGEKGIEKYLNDLYHFTKETFPSNAGKILKRAPLIVSAYLLGVAFFVLTFFGVFVGSIANKPEILLNVFSSLFGNTVGYYLTLGFEKFGIFYHTSMLKFYLLVGATIYVFYKGARLLFSLKTLRKVRDYFNPYRTVLKTYLPEEASSIFYIPFFSDLKPYGRMSTFYILYKIWRVYPKKGRKGLIPVFKKYIGMSGNYKKSVNIWETDKYKLEKNLVQNTTDSKKEEKLKKELKKKTKKLENKMQALAKKGIYTDGFNEISFYPSVYLNPDGYFDAAPEIMSYYMTHFAYGRIDKNFEFIRNDEGYREVQEMFEPVLSKIETSVKRLGPYIERIWNEYTEKYNYSNNYFLEDREFYILKEERREDAA